ncbi:DUF4082 domain-containing protein [Actinosynnema sp. CA-299493]
MSATLIGSLLTGTAHAAPAAYPASPTNGSTVDVGVPLLIAGSAANGESGDVTGVDITFDGGGTWIPTGTGATGELWMHEYPSAEEGMVTYSLRASGSQGPGLVTGPFHFFVGGSATPPEPNCLACALNLPRLPGRPVVQDIDDAPVELGLRVRVDRSGHLTGAAITRGAYTGPRTLHVWSADGTLLAEQVFPSNAPYYLTLQSPVPVVAGEEYVVSYYTPEGGYASTEDYFSASMVIAPYTMSKGAGVYSYGGGFPADTWNGSNYWIMPTFGR